EGGDRRSCYVVGARYDPPPAGLAVFEGGAVAFTDGFYKAAAALTDNLALEYEGCSGGVEMVLRFSTEAHSVEDAVRRDAPIAAHLCYYIKEKDTPECVYLKSKLASVGRGCLLREAKLTRKPEEP